MADSQAPRPSPASRLQAIRNSGLLDRRGEEQFGHLTEHERNILYARPANFFEARLEISGHTGGVLQPGSYLIFRHFKRIGQRRPPVFAE